MKLQHIVSTLLLLFLGLLDNALGAAVRPDGHPALPHGPCSYTINGAGIASVICHFPTDAPHGGPSGHGGAHASGSSHNTLPAQINASWTPVTETYTTISVGVVHPLNYTQTYTDLSTELTSTTFDMKTTTQTVVEIAGYSTIGTHTTTFLAPASSSTYSAIKTVTVTSSELIVPSSDTLTLTGHLPPSARAFPTIDAQKRGLRWGPAENGTGVLAYHDHAARSARGNFTAQPTEMDPHLHDKIIQTVPILSDGADVSIQTESTHEPTRSSTTSVLVITVTNTYSVTPTTEHSQKTMSSLKDTTSWLIGSPAAPNSTHHLSMALTMHNSSAVVHATTMVPDISSAIIHTTSVESAEDMPTGVTGTASPTSTSGSSVIFNGLVLPVCLAFIAMRLSLYA